MEPGAALLVPLRTLPLLAVSYYVGAFCRRVQLPQITGYLLTGVLGGPHGVRLLTADITRCARPALPLLRRAASSARFGAQPAVAGGQPMPGGHRHCRWL